MSTSGLGVDAISRAVYGWRGCANNVAVDADSTTCPACITTIRSQYSEASARSWVIRMVAMLRARASSLTSSMIAAWVVTSRPVVGSSAISSEGLQASDSAIITRWHCPPESSNGYEE